VASPFPACRGLALLPACGSARTTRQELQHFAKRLRADYDAVRAALSLGWSNGQTKGQTNRLKTIKRQMYGRASLDLLGRRFLLAA